jgi:deazaflavin-dependent oxidoreductase (nitroreductase family)
VTFTTPPGTHGTRQPRGPILRFVNRISVDRVRRTGGRTMGMNVLILRTVGRKSGQERATPVAWFPGTGASWLVAASANGAPGHPAWYLNLAAHPEEVEIEVQGRTVAVTAEELHGAEREEAWAQIVAAVPRFGGYEQKTDRVIPVVRLVERG